MRILLHYAATRTAGDTTIFDCGSHPVANSHPDPICTGHNYLLCTVGHFINAPNFATMHFTHRKCAPVITSMA